jgi:adenine-specific DNA-methyltransferase
MMGVSFVTLNRWEKGKAQPSSRNQRRIAELEVAAPPGDSTSSDPFRPIQYLGSKMRLVGPIDDLIGRFVKKGVVCDLFSGSGVVSHHLARKHTVIAVDIQEYACVLARALLDGNPCKSIVAYESTIALQPETLDRLRAVYLPLIDYEQACLAEARNGKPARLIEFSQYASYFTFRERQGLSSIPSKLSAAFKKVQKHVSSEFGATRTPTPVGLYYGGVYFSYRQAADLDSILSRIVQDSSRRDSSVPLAALLSTASTIVNTVGKQFAQPMKLEDKAGNAKALLLERTLRDRSYDVWTVFHESLSKFGAVLPRSPTLHRVFCKDYRDFLNTFNEPIDCFYADPPYTIDHYSRFYHVLETIARADFPELSRIRRGDLDCIMRGLYRTDRHQSPFCIPSQVEGAFDALFKGIARFRVPLVLSYSPYSNDNNDRPRVLTLENLCSLARKYFEKVAVVSGGHHAHRKLHSTTSSIQPRSHDEVFLTCSFTRDVS